jgi:hypothetical protein
MTFLALLSINFENKDGCRLPPRRMLLQAQRPQILLKNRFDAENPLHFYSCLVVEMVWNKEAYHGSKECNESGGGHSHKRSDFKMVWGGGGWQTTYGAWSHLPFSYGDYSQPSRRVQHELCTWGYRFKKREQGDAYEVCLISLCGLQDIAKMTSHGSCLFPCPLETRIGCSLM